jgi:hypothetical protein
VSLSRTDLREETVRIKIFLLIAFAMLALLAGPAFAQKVFIDYDRDYDFDAMDTFAWKSTPDTSLAKSSPLMHSRVVNGIEHHLTMAGLREDDGDPDVYVTYHTSSEKKVSIQTTDFGYGYPGSWYRGGYYGHYGVDVGTSTSTVHAYDVGTLVVDVWDAETNELVWRGMAANITIVDSPDKMAKKLDKALKKIVNKSRKLAAKD